MMYCPNCGSSIPEAAQLCPGCARPVGRQQPVQRAAIPNHLVEAILATLCCCLPFGIVSIVYASQVNTKAGLGDIAGAQEASDNARMWAWISFGIGLVVNGIYLVATVLPVFLRR